MPYEGISFVQLRLRPDEVAALDRYRGDQSNPPSRMKAAHQIVRRALAEHLLPRESNQRVGA